MPHIKRLEQNDRPALRQFWQEHWGGLMVVHGNAYTADDLDGFAAVEENAWLGLVTFTVEGNAYEIISLNSLREGMGIGTALIRAVETEARRLGCARLVIATTNDNTHALRLYQKYGFELAALRLGALTESRRLKPSIPLIGNDGIPMRDELELELRLDGGADLDGS
jgi:ribosomal protein S18 acetylase RimI-like enzyme